MPRSSFGPYGMAEHGDEETIGVLGIDDDLRNLLAVAQAEMRPGLAGVGGFVDAVAGRQVGALQAFAAADVDDVRIRWRQRDRADRAGRLVVEDRNPGASVVGRLPDAAVDRRRCRTRWAATARRPRPWCGRRGTARSSASACRRRATARPGPASRPTVQRRAAAPAAPGARFARYRSRKNSRTRTSVSTAECSLARLPADSVQRRAARPKAVARSV